MPARTMTSRDQMRVALEARVSRSSVDNYLLGRSMTPAIRQRIEEALGVLGLQRFLRQDERTV